MDSRLTTAAAIGYLVLCLLLGGASAAGAIANGLLQLIGLGLIVASLWALRKNRLPPEARPLFLIGGLFALVVVLYLLPLPSAWWSALPGRAFVKEGFELLGMPPPALPISLSREGSIASALAIIPPAAMFLLMLQLGDRQRRKIAWVVIAAACVSVLWGAMQVVGGSSSPLRFYEITNRMVPVGFFANANHLATLLLCALPFTGLLATGTLSERGGKIRQKGRMILAGSVALFLAVGITSIGSLAGYSLFVPVAVATVVIYKFDTRSMNRKWIAALGVLLTVFIAFALIGPINQEALSAKSGSASSRRVIAERTIDAVQDFFPVGSGLGTFQDVYRLYDDPTRTDHSYVNHAHQDYLEVALELGVPGLLLILAFIGWWGVQTYRAWTIERQGIALARVATVVIGVILLHSLVDYPLRTSAIATVLAVACGMLVPSPKRGRRSEKSRAGGVQLRHVSAD